MIFVFEQLSRPKIAKIAKNDIFGPFEFAKIWFHVNQSGGKMIKFQQSQCLTSHFESFWSIVLQNYSNTNLKVNNWGIVGAYFAPDFLVVEKLGVFPCAKCTPQKSGRKESIYKWMYCSFQELSLFSKSFFLRRITHESK